jgi:hypothetical protein
MGRQRNLVTNEGPLRCYPTRLKAKGKQTALAVKDPRKFSIDPVVVERLDPPGVLVVEPLSTCENHDPRHQLFWGLFLAHHDLVVFAGEPSWYPKAGVTSPGDFWYQYFVHYLTRKILRLKDIKMPF